MQTTGSRILATAMGCAMLAGAASADGVYQMYDYQERYIGELEIIDDVIGLDGVEYARLELPDLQMRFYVPPDGAYVTMLDTNPAIRDRWPYHGYWVSTAPRGQERWVDCEGGAIGDHEGRARFVYGDLVLTNTGIDDEGLVFELEIGHCGNPVETWAVNRTSSSPDIGVNANDIEILVEICGNERDTSLRALGCSDLIGHPDASVPNVSWAYWSRAYVRCGTVPISDTVADLMSAVRLEPAEWQRYYKRINEYYGPMDGRLNYELHAATERFANRGCR